MAWGGPRPGSGRKPGSKALRRLRKAECRDILSMHDEYALWTRFLTSKDERVAIQALIFLTTQRDGRAYQQINPLQAQRLAAGDDPKLAAVLQNLLHQPGAAVELTEKKARITSGTQALENVNAEGKAKLPPAPSRDVADMPVTLDASATSQSDPSGRKAGVGQNGAESHTENIQVSEVVEKKGESK